MRKGGGMAKSRVGIVGLGIMGSAMAANLIKAGFKVVGHDPVPACRARHRKAGGILAENASDLAASVNVIVTSLPSAKALLDFAGQLARTKRTRQIVIETSTLPIPVKEAARRKLAAAGITLLDCPLSGTGAQARVKDLIVYGSGDAAAFKRTVPVLRASRAAITTSASSATARK